MKPKTFNKKLTLNKETVTNLSNDALVKIKGGIWTIQYTCNDFGVRCDTNNTCGRETNCVECFTQIPTMCNYC